MGKYQAYPEYKNSGVELLGEIPSEWKVLRYKNILKIMQGMAFKSSEYVDLSSVVNIRMGNIKKGGDIDLKHNTKYLPENYKGIYSDYELYEGDAIIAMTDMSPTLDFLAVPAILKGLDENTSYLLNQRVGKLLLDKEFDIRFIRYLLLSDELRSQLKGKGLGTVQANMSNDDLYSSYLFCPSLKERLNIANFLDHETAKIDTLIEKQQQLIALLKEKRQAVISHAVTKGLNPDAPMRDSGVEWLGEVPKHWVVKRLKHISPKIGVGLVINPSTYTREDGVYFIFGGDVKEYYFDLSKTRRISIEDSNNLLPSRLNHRDLVSIRVGYPGITAVVTEELEGSNCASVIVIRRGEYNSDWLCAAMNTWIGRQQVDLVSYGAAQKQFNVADAIEFVFPVPTKNEQDNIAAFVHDSLLRFNRLSDKAEKQIELLQERRTALISAAVTGKIDVRNWKFSE